MASVAESGQSDIHVESTRFGTFDVPPDQVLEFPQGLVGMPAARRFVILEHRPGSPFKWMLCVDDPELAFAVADPLELVRGYDPPLRIGARVLGAAADEVGLFVIVTVPSDPMAMTVNLMAPIAVDLRTRRGRQLVLEDSRYDPAYLVLDQTPRPATEP